jgi:hypothetical protein
MMLISMRIRMQGFIVFDYENKYPEAKKQLAQWLSEGKLKRQETIVKGGILKAEEALVGLFDGKNICKLTYFSLSKIKLIEVFRQDDGGGCEARGCQSEAVAVIDIYLEYDINVDSPSINCMSHYPEHLGQTSSINYFSFLCVQPAAS